MVGNFHTEILTGDKMSRRRNNVERAFAAYLLLNNEERGEFITLCKGYVLGLGAGTQAAPIPGKRRRVPQAGGDKLTELAPASGE